MHILRHLESQLKYIVIETEHLFPSGLHVTKATLQGLWSTISEISSTLFFFLCHYSFNLKGISDCKCRNCWSIIFFLQFLSFLPFCLLCLSFVQSSSFPFFFFFNCLNYWCISFSLSCSFLLEGKVLRLCSNRNFGHLPVGWVSYLILGKEPS